MITSKIVCRLSGLLIVTAVSIARSAEQPAALPPPPVADQPAESFLINLDRPWHKGDHQPFELVVATVRTTTRDAQDGAEGATQETALGAHLVGDCEVTEVDATGHELENTITVREFTRTTDSDEESKQVLPAGAKIVARPGEHNDTRFTVDGKEPAKDVLNVLDTIIAMRPAQETIDMAAIFTGDEPKKRRTAGETWPVSAKAAIKAFKRQPEQATKNLEADVDGAVHLVDVENCNGQRCMRIEAELKIKNIVPAPTTQKEDIAWKPSTFEGKYTWFLPVAPDANRQDYSGTATWSHPWEAEQDGKKLTGEATVRRELHLRSLPIEANDKKK
jgi:hypothetical protein